MKIKLIILLISLIFTAYANNINNTSDISNNQESLILRIDSKVSKEFVSNILITKDEKYFLTISEDRNVNIYDINTGNKIRTIYGKINTFSKEGKLYSAALSPDNKYLATTGYTTNNKGKFIIRIYNFRTGKIIKTLESHDQIISSMIFTKDSKHLISAGNKIKIWNIENFSLIRTIDIHNYYISALNIIEQNNQLYIISGDNHSNLFVSSFNTGTVISKFKSHFLGAVQQIETNGNDIAFKAGIYLYITNFNLQKPEYISSFDSYIKYTKDGKKLMSGGLKYYNVNGGYSTINTNDKNEKSYSISKQKNPHNGKITTIAISKNKIISFNINKYELLVRDIKTFKIHNKKRTSITGSAKIINSVGINKNNIAIGWIKDNLTWKSKHYANNLSEKERVTNHYPKAKLIHNRKKSLNLNNFKLLNNKVKLNNVILENDKFKLSQSTNTGGFIYTKAQDNVLYINDKNDKFVKWIESTRNINAWTFYKDKIITAGERGKLSVYKLNDKKKGKRISSLIGHQSDIISIGIYNDKLISVSKNSIIKIWNLRDITKKEKIFPLVTIFIDKSGEFVIWTNEGYFTISSQKVLQYVSWHKNKGYRKEAISYKIDKFYDIFFRPDLVKLKLQGKDITPYTKGITAIDALKNPPPEIFIKLIDNKNLNKNSSSNISEINTDKVIAKVIFNVSDLGGGIGTIRIYQEGKLIKTIGDSKINKIIANIDTKLDEKKAEKKYKDNQYLALSKAVNGKNLKLDDQISKVTINNSLSNQGGDYKVDIALKSGINQISIEAFNKTNTITSFRSTVNINAKIQKKKPKIYAIVAGVNKFDSSYSNSLHNLKYAKNDANAIKNMILNTKKKIFKDVEIIYLTNNEVTKDNIKKAFESVKKKANIEDTIVFYISTHGISANGKFYLIPSNNKQASNLIEFKNIFKNSSDIKALNQIFMIDACQSGSANDIASAVYDSRASVLARSSGIHLLSASTSGTNAFENDKYKHSNFTYQIIKAVNNTKIDKNKDGFISIIEISNILKNQDNNNSKQFPVIQNIGNDIMMKKIIDDK